MEIDGPARGIMRTDSISGLTPSVRADGAGQVLGEPHEGRRVGDLPKEGRIQEDDRRSVILPCQHTGKELATRSRFSRTEMPILPRENPCRLFQLAKTTSSCHHPHCTPAQHHAGTYAFL